MGERTLRHSRHGSRRMNLSATRTTMGRPAVWKWEHQSSSGGNQWWWQSMERSFRYTTMLCNGGARTFNHLSSLRVYGDVELQKEECVNHVMKCLGTAQVGSIGKEGWRHARRGWLRETEADDDRPVHEVSWSCGACPSKLYWRDAGCCADSV